MLRILGQIWISGNKASLEPLVQAAVIPSGELKQMGLLRKVPDVDSWFYGSPYYQFQWDFIDEELCDFLETHYHLKSFLIPRNPEIEHAHLMISPIDQNFEHLFSCLFSHKMMGLLWELGLGLEISPASVMPEVPFWSFASI